MAWVAALLLNLLPAFAPPTWSILAIFHITTGAPLLPLTIGGAAAHPLSSVRRLQDLEEIPIVWREPGSGTRAVVERALRRAGSRQRSRRGDLQLASTEAIKTAVALGAGLGFLSRVSMQRELASGALRIVSLPGLRVERSFSWVLPAAELAGLPGAFVRYAIENSHQFT